mgnify:CR=1 FL=1
MRGGIGRQPSLANGATTRWIMARHHTKMVKASKLRCEIIELERQLKQHPLGTIILKAQIKEKKKQMKNLNYTPIIRGIDLKYRGAT